MAEAKFHSASETTSCGDETCPGTSEEEARQSVQEARQPAQGRSADEELWEAARNAEEERVRECLDRHAANVNWVKELSEELVKGSDRESGRKSGRKSVSEGALVYRGWKMASRALHVAVLYGADETGDHKQSEQARAVPVVELLLARRADVNAMAERVYFDKEKNLEMCRRVQAIHMAAGAGNAKVVELLLEHGAEKNAEAFLQPAAETALEGSKNRQVLFRPIHDAVLYNHVECVKLLLRREVKINVENIDGNTPLHVAANLGYVPIVELLLGLREARRAFEKAVDQRTEMNLKATRQSRRTGGNLQDLVHLVLKAPQIPNEFNEEQKQLLIARNAKERTALELAAKGGRFPVEDIYWFATCLFAFETSKGKARQELVDVFASVAVAFPDVAIDLLRIADESGGSQREVNVVDPHNLCRVRQALTCSDPGMKKKVLEKFEYLSDRYPEAAVVLLDALTTTPEEKHPVIDPLPRRFVPPRDDLYPLHCVYEKDHTWELDPAEGVEEWHKELVGDIAEGKDGPTDERGAAPVPATVHVVNLQGFVCPGVLCKLTRQTEDYLFTKLAVHALLKYAWDSMRTLFVLDMVYEGAAIVVISRWIVTTPDEATDASQFLFSDFMNRLAWCIVASQGSLEGIILMWTAIRHECTLSHGDTMDWAWRNVHRICLSIMTIGLACASQEEHWPSDDQYLSAALGATSFGHWLTMLYKVRAFVKTGTRLLPIMKAILPIGGMLVILGFLMVGFMHVFWAMDRSHANGVNTWQFMTFLFIADNFINDESLEELSQGRQVGMMLLGGISLFIFTSCSLNLFIAVLSEVYEQEQERMLVTFLKERANICSFLILRPEIPVPESLTQVMSFSGWKLQLGLLLACVASSILVVGCCAALQISSWPGVLVFVFWAVLQQALMKHGLTKGWEKKYIWYCADLSGAEEIFSLGHSQQDKMLPQSRAWKLKRYITEIMTELHKHDEKFAIVQETQKALGSKLDQALAAINKSLGVKGSGKSVASTALSELKEAQGGQREEAEPVSHAHLEVTTGLQAEAEPVSHAHLEVTTGLQAEAPTALSGGGKRKKGPKGAAQRRGGGGGTPAGGGGGGAAAAAAAATRGSVEQLAADPADGG